MQTITRRSLLASAAALGASATRASACPSAADGEWIPLFDGHSLNGWKPSQNRASWKVVDGLLTCDGPRSHLFYAGPVHNAEFRNFELTAELMARPRSNSGLYFHTRYQESGFPEQGFEVQVNNTALGQGSYRERKKTASLYAVRNVYKQFVRDDEWFRLDVLVRGRQVRIHLNGMLMVDWVEPDPPVVAPDFRGRVLSHGTFALQCHDPGCRVFFKSIAVKPLPDQAPPPTYQPVADDLYRTIQELGAHNYPVVDYHTHLKGGWTLEEALDNSRQVGIQYGIAINCGQGFPVQSDEAAAGFLKSMRGQPVFAAMQAEGREWVRMFSPAVVAGFDYVFSDAMTFTHEGQRIRLWIPEEVPPISDPERFMDVIVDQIVGVLSREPIDIYANPTFLPGVMADRYDQLWTPARIQRVVQAAVANDVAIEINNRYRIPSPPFIKAAKAAGARFSFGTNNADRNIGRLEYPLAMVKECGLGWQDIFVPRAGGEKPVEKRGLPK